MFEYGTCICRYFKGLLFHRPNVTAPMAVDFCVKLPQQRQHLTHVAV